MNDKFKKKKPTKNPTYYHKSVTLQMASTVLLSGRKQTDSVFVRCSKRILLGLSASKSSFSYTRPHSSSNKALKVICCNSDDQCWRNNTSALLHQLRSYLPLPSAPPTYSISLSTLWLLLVLYYSLAPAINRRSHFIMSFDLVTCSAGRYLITWYDGTVLILLHD